MDAIPCWKRPWPPPENDDDDGRDVKNQSRLRRHWVMKRNKRGWWLLGCASIVFASLTGVALSPSASQANAADAGSPAGERTAKVILADHVEAIGGAKALKRHKTLRLVRKVTVKGMGIEGTEERFATAENKFFSRTTIPGIGVVRTGSDGKTFWSEDPINGMRVLSGLEQEQARRDARWNAELHLAELYQTVNVVPPPTNAPAGAALECLELSSPKVPTLTLCFDKTTHQRVFQTGRQATPQGEIPFEARFSAWKTYGGISMPTVEETKAGPTTILITLSEVRFDEKLDPGLFKLKAPKSDKKAAPPTTGPEARTAPKPATATP
jgi:hypothetical protein